MTGEVWGGGGYLPPKKNLTSALFVKKNAISALFEKNTTVVRNLFN